MDKKLTQRFYKHDELTADPIIGTPSPIPGFSIHINALHQDHNIFKKHFRSYQSNSSAYGGRNRQNLQRTDR